MIAFLAAFFAVSHPDAYLQELQKPCAGCSAQAAIPTREDGKTLRIFMSFSVPLESWKDLSGQLEMTDGFFVLKGFPDNSFEEGTLKIMELRTKGVNAPIDIDPAAFEEFEIDSVPAIVLEDGKKTDTIQGNLRLDAALREIAEKGECCERAKELLETLSNPK